MIIFTSVCANYIPKAKVLARSVKRYHPDAKFIVCLLEREIPHFAENFEYFDEVILAKEIGIKNFDNFIFQHSIVEASTAVKGEFFRYLMDRFPEESNLIYLDPDIEVYGCLDELVKSLEKNSIVLVPHLTDPEKNIDAVMDNELSALQHGVFNLGFLAVNNDKIGREFIEWWANRLRMFCYDDIPRGIFTDQKWIDLAPCFFDVFILKHPGYDTAPWNLSTRKITKNENIFLVNGVPLRFFHFSGFDSGANEGMINKYVPNKDDVVYSIRDGYVGELDEMEQAQHGNYPWTYDSYFNGVVIKRQIRLAFRNNEPLKLRLNNPFSNSNIKIFIIDRILRLQNRNSLFFRLILKKINKWI